LLPGLIYQNEVREYTGGIYKTYTDDDVKHEFILDKTVKRRGKVCQIEM